MFPKTKISHGAPWEIVVLISVLLGGCAIDNPGVSPHRDRFYFPTGLAIDAPRQLLYVTNSNADLRHNGATITAIDLSLLPEDLSEVSAMVNAGALDCQPSPIDLTIWECAESPFINPETTLRMDDYPRDIEITSDGKRLFVPERGSSYLLWADIVHLDSGGVDIRCNDDFDAGCGGVGTDRDCATWDCDDQHKVNYSAKLQQMMPSEPFGIYLNEMVATYFDGAGNSSTCLGEDVGVDCDCAEENRCLGDLLRDCCLTNPDHLYVAHITGGEVSFFTSEDEQVTLQDIHGGFFSGSSNIQGSFALSAQNPGDPDSLVYLSSREDNSLASFGIKENQFIIDAARTPVGAFSGGRDVRGLQFSPDGQILYFIDQAPPALVAMDMSIEEGGAAKHEPIWVTEICHDASILRLIQNPDFPDNPNAQLAYMVCFSSSLVHVVDTLQGNLIDQIVVGKGPNDLVFDVARKRAFIANFHDNTIGVIDLDPSHSRYHHMVLRLGQIENLLITNYD